jgi:hypothetical protein
LLEEGNDLLGFEREDNLGDIFLKYYLCGFKTPSEGCDVGCYPHMVCIKKYIILLKLLIFYFYFNFYFFFGFFFLLLMLQLVC